MVCRQICLTGTTVSREIGRGAALFDGIIMKSLDRISAAAVNGLASYCCMYTGIPSSFETTHSRAYCGSVFRNSELLRAMCLPADNRHKL